MANAPSAGILPADQYQPMLDLIRGNQVPDYAVTALRDMNPDFARWMDEQETNNG